MPVHDCVHLPKKQGEKKTSVAQQVDTPVRPTHTYILRMCIYLPISFDVVHVIFHDSSVVITAAEAEERNAQQIANYPSVRYHRYDQCANAVVFFQPISTPHLLHGAGDHAPHVARAASLHGVRLPRPRLSVAEKADVETVERRLDELGNLREYLLLPGAVLGKKANMSIEQARFGYTSQVSMYLCMFINTYRYFVLHIILRMNVKWGKKRRLKRKYI